MSILTEIHFSSVVFYALFHIPEAISMNGLGGLLLGLHIGIGNLIIQQVISLT
jgi:hypothetical protein